MENEEEDEGEADPAPPAAGFIMGDALVEFEIAQAKVTSEQHAILNPIQP